MISKLAFILLLGLGSAAQDINAGGDGEERRKKMIRRTMMDHVNDLIERKDGEMIEKENRRSLRYRNRPHEARKNSRDLVVQSRALIDNEDGVEEDSNEPWSRGTFKVAAKQRDSVYVCAPSLSQIGDILVLFISSSGGTLPMAIDGWKRGAECFKKSNKQKTCSHTSGNDLGTVMFHRMFEDSDACWDVKIKGGTTWAIMTSITNANQQHPIGDVAVESCDKTIKSRFPSVLGGKDDVVLFSQAFDDAFVPSDFTPMSGASSLTYLKFHHDAGFLMGKELDHSGPTGSLETGGKGGWTCKDVLLSIVVNRLGD